MMRAIRHPCVSWETDSLGETTARVFGPDQKVAAVAFAPSTSSETGADTDATVTTTATLYLRTAVEANEHDDWTIAGHRWAQQGAAAAWPLGTVVTITRRTG